MRIASFLAEYLVIVSVIIYCYLVNKNVFQYIETVSAVI